MRREREEGNEKTLPVTARSLETMIRLSTAHAKLRQSKEVSLADAEAALGVMKYAIYADEKKAMDAANAAAARKEARRGNGDSDDEDGDDDADTPAGAAQAEAAEARSRRRTRRSTGEADPSGEEAAEEAATEHGHDGDAPESSQRKRRRTAPAEAEAEVAAVAAVAPAAAPAVSEERKNAIMQRLAEAFNAERTEQMHMIAALEAINREAFEGGEFAQEELGAVLAMMESENKVMTEDGYINLI
jgi:DNA replication licensing factor MCM3